MVLPLHRTWAGLRLGTLMVVVGMLAIVPTEILSGIPSMCLFRNVLGVECLGCGMVRAASCLLHGHLAEAAVFNRLILVAVPVAGLVALRDVRVLLRRRNR